MSSTDTQKDKTGTVSLADEEAVKQILVSTVFGLWDIVNNLTRLRPSKRERYRVTIFGSARARPACCTATTTTSPRSAGGRRTAAARS